MSLTRSIAAASPSPSPFGQLPAPSAPIPELVIGGIFLLLGIRSLVKWMRTEIEAGSIRDQVLIALHSAARVGLWFAFAGFFFGYAFVDQVGPFVKWYLFVPLGLAAIQLVTAMLLARSPAPPRGGEGGEKPSRPGVILETRRLILRPWSPVDAEAAFRIYGDPEVVGMMEGQPDSSVEVTRENLVNRVMAHHEEHGFGMWAVEEKVTGEVIGNCGLKYLDGGPEIEVGYHFAREAWGKGYATEAARACVEYGFNKLGLHRIVGVVLPSNVRSQRVLENAGLVRRGMGHYYGKDLLYYVAERPSGSTGATKPGVGPLTLGNPSSMNAPKQPPGPLEPEKHGETAEPGHPQPEAAEVESARQLENQARDELRRAGLTDADIRRLADEYVALDRGEDLDEFIAWAKERVKR